MVVWWWRLGLVGLLLGSWCLAAFCRCFGSWVFLAGGLGWVFVLAVWWVGFCVVGLGCWAVVGVVVGRRLCCCPHSLMSLFGTSA